MYEQLFQLRRQPFSVSPNTNHYFPSAAMQTALAQAKMTIDRANGPAVCFGNAGCGKTLLLEMLAEDYDGQYRVARIPCSKMSARIDLLQSILFALEQPYRDMSEGELRLNLVDYVKPCAACPNGILVLVDDAHWLNANLLDELRVLSGIVHDGAHRCHLVMTGNRAFEEALADPQNDSFAQRVASRTYLGNLSSLETTEYVRIHLRRAGGGNRQFFTDSALQKIYDLTRGIPRAINHLCDYALVSCALNGYSIVDDGILNQAWHETQQFPAPSSTGSPSSAGTIEPEQDGSTIEYGLLDLDNEASAPLNNSDIYDAALTSEKDVAAVEFADSELESVTADLETTVEPVTTIRTLAEWSAESYEATTADEAEQEGVPGADSCKAGDVASANPFEEDFLEVEDIPLRLIELSCRHNASAIELNYRDIPVECRSDSGRSEASVTSPLLKTTGPFAETGTSAQVPEWIGPEAYQASDLEAYITMIESRRLDVSGISPQFDAGAKSPARQDAPEDNSIHAETGAMSDPGEDRKRVPRSLRMHSVVNDSQKVRTSDDRDMIVVNRPHQSRPAVMPSSDVMLTNDVTEGQKTSIGKGKAVRLEYRQLFDQLRQIPS